MSQRDLASRLGVHQSAVGQWEMGQKKPDMLNRIELSAVLGIRFADLLPEFSDAPPRVRDRDLDLIVQLIARLTDAHRAALLRVTAALLAEEYLETQRENPPPQRRGVKAR